MAELSTCITNSVRNFWGGSPATEQTEMGLETEEVNQQVDVRETADYNDTEEQTEPSDNTSSQCSSEESSSTSEDSSIHKRREMLDETLSTTDIKG